jgi:hypothetical protein
MISPCAIALTVVTGQRRCHRLVRSPLLWASAAIFAGFALILPVQVIAKSLGCVPTWEPVACPTATGCGLGQSCGRYCDHSAPADSVCTNVNGDPPLVCTACQRAFPQFCIRGDIGEKCCEGTPDLPHECCPECGLVCTSCSLGFRLENGGLFSYNTKDLQIDLTNHLADGDSVTVTLVAPSEFNRYLGPGADMAIWLNDDAGLSIDSVNGNLQPGAYRPHDPLSKFQGRDLRNWSLDICNNSEFDVFNIGSLSLVGFCPLMATPVDQTSWGTIKANYED